MISFEVFFFFFFFFFPLGNYGFKNQNAINLGNFRVEKYFRKVWEVVFVACGPTGWA